jgi:hypothetical protein
VRIPLRPIVYLRGSSTPSASANRCETAHEPRS